MAFTEAKALATFLLQELDRAGIARFHCVGLSLGGMIGLQLALQAPERLERLVIANCRAYQLDAGKALWNERIAQVREYGVSAVMEETLSRWFTDGFRAAHPATIDRVRRMMQGVSASGYRAAAAMVRDFDAGAMLDALSCPTLVLAGAQDAAAPVAHLQDIARQLHANFFTFDHCAHLSNVECADAFTSTVMEFLAGEGASTALAVRQNA